MPLSQASGPPGTPEELFPAELLPAPGVRPPDAAPPRSSARRPAAAADEGRQLSLFGVESVDASPADLAGLLAGPGTVQRMGGTARVSVRVDAAWRVHALLAELAARGLEAGWRPVGPPPSPAGGQQEAPGGARQEAPDGAPPGAFDGAQREASDGGQREALDGVEEDFDGVEDFGADYPDDEPGGPVVGGGPARSVAPEAALEVAPEAALEAGPEDGPETRPEAATGSGPGSGPEGADDGGAGSGAGHSGGGSGGAGCFEVRTAYSSLLAGLARTWLDEAAKRAPERFFLTGPRLRLWVVAAGAPDAAGFRLRLGGDDPPQVRAAVVAALAEAGLSGEIVQVRPDEWEVRVAGRRRLARLAELVGERPPAVPAGRWPGG